MRRILALASFVVLAGCASVPGEKLGMTPGDPWEKYNRGMTQFNDTADAFLLKPAATVYRAAVPALARTGVSNFFSNWAEPWTALNAALQLKAEDAIETFMRFSINTFFGLGGLLDIASELGIERHYEDFGLTLGHWGVPTGPYFVMPIYGPSTLRDTLAFTTETAADPVLKVTDLAAKDSLVILRGLSLRASLLRLDDVLDGAALDKYTFSRDAFMQRRASLVFGDREPPEPAAAPATAPGTVPATAPTATPAPAAGGAAVPADPVKK